ncbi:MAG: hypothetical protein AAGG81_05140 [Chlamydiota bacterium]
MAKVVAQQSVIGEIGANIKLGDASFRGQVNRWGSKPLKDNNESLTKFGSLKGRGICFLNFVATPFREIYREGKNILVVAEKTLNFVRIFFQCIFREDGMSWSDCRSRLGDIVSSFTALFCRLPTVILDELKLGTGILYPGAAIRHNA